MALSETTSQHSRTPSGSVDVEQAQAALVEHYPRLVRLAYLVLPPSLARHRRVLTAHSLVQRALPRGRGSAEVRALPTQRRGGEHRPGGVAADATRSDVYDYLTTCVLRSALSGERRRRLGPWRLRPLPVRPGFFPLVLGLRLFPRSGGAYELALEKALSEISGAARAACALRGWEGMPDEEVCRVLEAAGVEEPAAALAAASAIRLPAAGKDRPVLGPSEFDPCSLQARPTDLLRRRQHLRAALAAVAAVVVCGGLLGLPGDSWGPDGAAAPLYARNPAAEQALEPGSLIRVPANAWKEASRTDFSAWPARGDLTNDEGLLRRALAVWARPGGKVRLSLTQGTSAGPPSGPPQLLYAGRVDGAKVVLLHDGQRAARYAEPEGADSGGAVLDIARTDGADTAGSGALVVSRSDSNVRYLTAPWISKAAEVDLLHADDEGRRLNREDDGVLMSLTGPGPDPRQCNHWPGLLLSTRGGSTRHLYTDLGELTPARVTSGNPKKKVRDATGTKARGRLEHTACGFRSMLGGGVRSVNTWKFATQLLPGGVSSATWLCTRGETWRGKDARIFTSFRRSGLEQGEQAMFTSRVTDTPACGPRRPHAVSGGLWKSDAGNWYVLAAGSKKVASIRVKGKSGGPSGTSLDRKLALPAKKGAKARITARLANGEKLSLKR
ncbi:hypothetical protein G4Z16_25180 [Streptomyces bathyalis]|uniref:Uncharacterized protein n=1 Tax=Streptomyces bathyalis TaxID=2710756 RepID=A0A7T1WVN7_9ACTN|nr:hypothetical protein [Streptomyces bathyalis]QPP09160.1 hypothetical protein G4Z16_25180 [Streptomyces bathyalis]